MDVGGSVGEREGECEGERTQPYASHQGYATCRQLLLSAGCYRCAPVLKLSSGSPDSSRLGLSKVTALMLCCSPGGTAHMPMLSL